MASVTTRLIHFKQFDERTTDERIGLRFPQLATWLTATILRLPPGSRLRGILLSRAVSIGMSATNRMDSDTLLLQYAPDCEITWSQRLTTPGNPAIWKGHEGIQESLRENRSVWAFHFVPEQLISAKDWFIVPCRMEVEGAMSGLELNTEVAFLYTMSDGLVRSQRQFDSLDDALEAAEAL